MYVLSVVLNDAVTSVPLVSAEPDNLNSVLVDVDVPNVEASKLPVASFALFPGWITDTNLAPAPAAVPPPAGPSAYRSGEGPPNARHSPPAPAGWPSCAP